jgi:predicted ester cyclase
MPAAAEVATRIVELTDSGNFRARERLIHPDCEIVTSGAGRLTRQGFTRYGQAFATAFPQAEHVLDQIVELADTVVLEGTWIATQTGPFETPQGHIPATGQEMRTRVCLVFQIVGGVAVSIHGYWDQLEMLQQLGLVPEPAAP